MDKSYLIKRKSLLLAGIKDADNTASIIGFDNMSLRTDPLDIDPSNFVIPTEGKVNQMVIDAERNSHKQIKGEISVDTEADVTASMAAFSAGQDLTLDDGTIYNNKPYDPTTAPNGATVGDVVFYVSSATATNFKTEEALVKSDYTMVLLSSTNSDDQRLDTVEGELAGISDDLMTISNEDVNNLKVSNDKDLTTSYGAINHTDATAVEPNKIPTREEVASAVRGLNQDVEATEDRLTTTEGVATEAHDWAKSNTTKLDGDGTTANPGALADIQTNATDIQTNATAIGTLKDDDASHAGRLQALEDAEDLDDKVWTGSIDGAATIDLSALVDENGDKFDFAIGDKLELVFEHTGDAVEEGRDVVVGATNASSYTIGTAGFTAKLANTGTVSLVKATGGQGTLADFKLIRIVEAKKVKAVSSSYSKTESDGKYTLKTTTDALDTRVTANTAKGTSNANATIALTTRVTTVETKATTNATAIATKQDRIDNALTTSSKSVTGAINELKTRTDNNEADTVELNKGKFDIKGDGTKITEIFDADGTLKTPVKDLTALITEDEIYNAIENNDSGYKIKIAGKEYVTISNIVKVATLAEFTIEAVINGEKFNYTVVIKPNVNTAPVLNLSLINVRDATKPTQAVNKQTMEKYVDDNVVKYGWVEIDTTGGGGRALDYDSDTGKIVKFTTTTTVGSVSILTGTLGQSRTTGMIANLTPDFFSPDTFEIVRWNDAPPAPLPHKLTRITWDLVHQGATKQDITAIKMEIWTEIK